MMDLGLHGKIAMVGGASRGLGYAVSRALAAEGARVSMASRDGAAIEAASSRIASDTGADTLACAANLAEAEAIERWFEQTLARFGGVDVLFVNTGGPPAGPALAFDDAAWQGALDLLLLSAVRMVRLAVPSMKARGGGSILFSTSLTVKEPSPSLALSNVARAGVAALSKTLATELAPHGIRVNMLMPGRIDTDRVRELDEGRSRAEGISVEEQRRRMESTIPLGRYGDAAEFAAAAAFLLSEQSRYTTGASLLVDGGLIRGV